MHLISARMKWICLSQSLSFARPTASVYSCQIHKTQASHPPGCYRPAHFLFPRTLHPQSRKHVFGPPSAFWGHGLFCTLNLYGSIKILLNKYLMREQLENQGWVGNEAVSLAKEQQPCQMIYDLRLVWPFCVPLWTLLMVHNWFLCLLCWPSWPNSAIVAGPFKWRALNATHCTKASLQRLFGFGGINKNL